MTYNQHLITLVETLIQIKNRKMAKDFLEDVLTPKEIISIAERIKVCEALLKGKTQRQIAQELGCAIATVTRGNRILQYGTGGIKKILK